MPPELWMAGAILSSLTIYALGGGADFGGGVWDLLASGPRARAQREAVAHAIGPIWEANHVWLILVVVLLFVGFPTGFAAITTALHIPLTLMLIGIVLRGSAFAFRSYDVEGDPVQGRWGRVFAVASVATPVMLGISVGAVASGGIPVRDGRAVTDFVSCWWAPFPVAVGLLCLALFAFLAAAYLTCEVHEPALQDDFRRRGLAAGVAVGACAWAALALAPSGAPLVWAGLLRSWWSLPFHALTAAAALLALATLWRRRYRLARACAMVQTALVLWGWGLAQFPYLLPPDLTFATAAAPARVLRLVLGALVAGLVLLAPSLAYLYKVFKGGPAFSKS
jgi:cytochrome d ubiquinol oxidase subunit II